MGMAASQARLLSLQARQSNLEYQGQQINQERTVLSQQCTALYNSLLSMTVPTPPSTNDYTTVKYEGINGATKYKFDASSVKPGSNGCYCITLGTTEYGPSLNKNMGYVSTTKIEEGMPKESDCDYLVAGQTAYTLEEAMTAGLINKTTYTGYCNAINNAAITKVDNLNGNSICGPTDFYIYQDENDKIHFVLKQDVNDGQENGAAVTYDFISNGEFTKNQEYDYTQLEFDPATGRITSMTIPTSFDDNKKPLTYTTIEVSASTVTDEAAYKDAYAKYEYEQYQYDKKQQEINAKTEVIQQQDRNLELKLQRLDNERQQIKAEVEAVEKVIQENIEDSYKTFSG